MKYIIPFLSIFILFSCSNGKQSSNSATSQAAPVPPPIPAERLIEIYESCDNIDFIFSNLPFSISQSDKASIQQTIRHIEPKQPESINPDCPYMAEQIFQFEGNIVLDAKIFFQEGCQYYLFYENGQPKYSASFTPAGVQFYNNILEQAKVTNANR